MGEIKTSFRAELLLRRSIGDKSHYDPEKGGVRTFRNQLDETVDLRIYDGDALRINGSLYQGAANVLWDSRLSFPKFCAFVCDFYHHVPREEQFDTSGNQNYGLSVLGSGSKAHVIGLKAEGEGVKQVPLEDAERVFRKVFMFEPDLPLDVLLYGDFQQHVPANAGGVRIQTPSFWIWYDITLAVHGPSGRPGGICVSSQYNIASHLAKAFIETSDSRYGADKEVEVRMLFDVLLAKYPKLPDM